MGKIKRVFLNFRVIVLFICLALGLFAINPHFWSEGVAIKSVERNSSAEFAGMVPPKANIAPTGFERIIAFNNKPVKNIEDYYVALDGLEADDTVSLKTNKATYKLQVFPETRTVVLNETEIIKFNVTREVNETINDSVVLVNKTFVETVEQNKTRSEVIGVKPLGLTVGNVAKSNLRLGLDLEGGTRVLLKPSEEVPRETIGLMVDSLKERLNVYGLSDVVVNEISDSPDFLGGGQRYILVEIAGATEDEVRDLLGKQGKFEAKIGNSSVFKGGNDITYVCRTAQCSGLDPNRGCGQSAEGWGCSFMFSITLNPDAAKRQADLTKNLEVIDGSLSEQLILFLDDQEVDRLSISEDLKGRDVTDIAITGGGSGAAEASAMEDALKNMKRLQTILITGSLPVKLDIVRVDTISPSLGREFLNNSAFVLVVAIFAVAFVLMIIYRRIIIALPIIFTALSEVFLTLSMAALIGWNIDLAAIAGIILAVGAGVNDQVVITDEAMNKETEVVYNWKDKIKRAFSIILSAYFTIVVAMVPLLFAGAGLLKGFAITTILAVTVGILITRPAYAAIVNLLIEK